MAAEYLCLVRGMEGRPEEFEHRFSNIGLLHVFKAAADYEIVITPRPAAQSNQGRVTICIKLCSGDHKSDVWITTHLTRASAQALLNNLLEAKRGKDDQRHG